MKKLKMSAKGEQPYFTNKDKKLIGRGSDRFIQLTKEFQ